MIEKFLKIKYWQIFIIIFFIALISIKGIYAQTPLNYLYSGDEKLKSNQYNEAIVEYSKAIEIIIKKDDSLRNVLDTMKVWNAEQTKEKLSVKNHLEWAYYNRGLALLKLGQFQKAYEDFNELIESGSTDSRIFFNRGLASYNLLNFQKSIIDFSKSIEIDSIIPEGYLNRGLAKYNLEDFRGAVFDFGKVIELNPEYAPAYYYRGIAKSALKDYRGSILDFNKVIEYNPKNADAYFNRGISKYYLNLIEGCCLDLSKAGELGHEKAYEAIKEFCN